MGSSSPYWPTRIQIWLTEEDPVFRDSEQTAGRTLHDSFDTTQIDRQKFTEADAPAIPIGIEMRTEKTNFHDNIK